MKTKIEYRDLGLIDYKKAWDFQEYLFEQVMEAKLQGGGSSPKNKSSQDSIVDETGILNPDSNTDLVSTTGQPGTPNFLLFCEHPAVFTIGKSGTEANLLINTKELENKGISCYKINRGGDITFHGPGQIVGYPIIDLENFSLGIKNYIELMEEAIIKTLGEYGIGGSRLPGATGVWLDIHDQVRARKICAIGVRASRHITMHGFAFNVNTDLSYYTYINPCGFTDKGVTSMAKELGKAQDIAKVKDKLRGHLLRLLGATALPVS